MSCHDKAATTKTLKSFANFMQNLHSNKSCVKMKSYNELHDGLTDLKDI